MTAHQQGAKLVHIKSLFILRNAEASAAPTTCCSWRQTSRSMQANFSPASLPTRYPLHCANCVQDGRAARHCTRNQPSTAAVDNSTASPRVPWQHCNRTRSQPASHVHARGNTTDPMPPAQMLHWQRAYPSAAPKTRTSERHTLGIALHSSYTDNRIRLLTPAKGRQPVARLLKRRPIHESAACRPHHATV